MVQSYFNLLVRGTAPQHWRSKSCRMLLGGTMEEAQACAFAAGAARAASIEVG